MIMITFREYTNIFNFKDFLRRIGVTRRKPPTNPPSFAENSSKFMSTNQTYDFSLRQYSTHEYDYTEVTVLMSMITPRRQYS